MKSIIFNLISICYNNVKFKTYYAMFMMVYIKHNLIFFVKYIMNM